ncbi:hypothetical protein BDK51DRAFT_21912 [Blyttiomyces helicus]|uniref:RRM domain-containing protein n=1 Tax=Blyttiomyces helicus TaxID=388810 RepID=A0A4V1ISQ0_9FUNG|nr:hypothetical protein BDK51DRAFT_21912 [Blyttiomyces helicus]|eukprot:RKO94327.1 hypothetical protein BDK51DRAFT_21912 [Blyttiomyces helicus]
MYGVAAEAPKTTLWMGDLEPWMDENYIKHLWYSMGETVNLKMIRDKYSGANAGYCFVDFVSNAAAMKHLNTINGTLIPGTNRVFKLNWASGGGLNDRTGRDERGPEFSVFVGDLGPEVTDFMLLQAFQSRYMTTKSAKVVTDPSTGMSRGYGFVRFTDESEQTRAMNEMQGQYIGSRPMRISMATPKNKPATGGTSPAPPASASIPLGGYYGGGAMGMGGMGMGGGPAGPPQAYNQYNDPTNTTVFVGGLSLGITDEELKR